MKHPIKFFHIKTLSETPGLHKATPDFSYMRRVTVCSHYVTLSSFLESKWTSSKHRVTEEAKIMMRMNHSKYGLSTTWRQAWRILYHFLQKLVCVQRKQQRHLRKKIYICPAEHQYIHFKTMDFVHICMWNFIRAT